MQAPELASVIYSIAIVLNSIYNLFYCDVIFYSIILSDLSFKLTDTVGAGGRVLLLSGSGPGSRVVSDQRLCPVCRSSARTASSARPTGRPSRLAPSPTLP